MWKPLLNSDHLNLARVLHPAIPCNVLCSFKGGNECSGGDMFEFGYIAVNQGFTHKINIFEKNDAVLHKLQYQRCYLRVWPSIHDVFVETNWCICEGRSQRSISVKLQKCTIICYWPFAFEKYVSSISWSV